MTTHDSDHDRSAEHGGDAFETARELLQRTTQLLTNCMAHAEAALETENVRELIDALHRISEETRGIARESADTGEQLASVHDLHKRKSA